MSQDNADIERQLQRTLDAYEGMSSYEIFDVWEGCGREVVRERYYKLVKDNHPDRYGGNVSSRIKGLSQEIFLKIQGAFRQLNKLENEQRVASPPDASRNRLLERLNNKAPAAASSSSSPPPASQSGEIPTQSPRHVVGKRPYKSKLSSALPPRQPLVHKSTDVVREQIRPTPSNDLSQTSEVFEAVTISTRDASTLEEDSMPEEERRAKLARLARSVRQRPPARPIVPSSPRVEPSLEEESAISVEERRDALARLRSKNKATPPPAGLRTPSRAPTSTPAPVTDPNRLRGQVPAASTSASPQTPKDKFNKAYRDHFKNRQYARALELFQEAHEAEPADGLYMTFYAYCLFQVHPDRKKECEELLRKAIETGHRQAMPDAHLFLGTILQSYTDSERQQRRALKHFEEAYRLNPTSRDAERWVNLLRKRLSQPKEEPDKSKDEGGLFSRLFKK